MPRNAGAKGVQAWPDKMSPCPTKAHTLPIKCVVLSSPHSVYKNKRTWKGNHSHVIDIENVLSAMESWGFHTWPLLLELVFYVNLGMIYHLTCCWSEILFTWFCDPLKPRPCLCLFFLLCLTHKTQSLESSWDLWPALYLASLIKSQINLTTCHKMQEVHPHTHLQCFPMLNHENKRDQMNQKVFGSAVGLVSNLIIFYALLLSAAMRRGALSSHVTADSCAHTHAVIHVRCHTHHANARWSRPHAFIDRKILFFFSQQWFLTCEQKWCLK